MKLFISHITEEADLAVIIKRAIRRDFLALVDIFVSSDRESIAAGENWLISIDQALRNADAELILCSSVSVRRPWINFEAGAGWMRKIPVIPICHSGLKPRELPMPLSVLQSIEANSSEGLKRLYVQIANLLGGTVPNVSFPDIAAEITAFEHQYAGKVHDLVGREITRDQQILKRIKEALADPNPRWRTLERLAFKAAISVDEAADLLRSDPEIVFSKGKKSGEQIVRLASR